MTKQGQKPIEVGLVLQGGGALGAYEWGAVTALLELMDEAETAGREVVLKGVTGVSIGAINAACIVGSHGRADARRRLNELWEDLRLDTPSFLPAQVQRDLAFFGLPGFYAPHGCVGLARLEVPLRHEPAARDAASSRRLRSPQR